MSVTFRAATIEDAKEILRMVQELANHERIPTEEIQISLNKIKKHGFGAKSFYESLGSKLKSDIVQVRLQKDPMLELVANTSMTNYS